MSKYALKNGSLIRSIVICILYIILLFRCFPLLSQTTNRDIFNPQLYTQENACESIELVVRNINKHLIKEIVWLRNDTVEIKSHEGKSIFYGGKNGEGIDDTHFRFPSSAVVYKNQLYIADLFNHRIQSWKLGDTKASTLIGNKYGDFNTPELHYPTDIFIDSKGQLYIVDQENHRIVLIDSTTKSVITVAGGKGRGSGSEQLRCPSAVFVHEKSGNIYVSDTYNHRIQKWIPGSKKAITVAGGNGLGRNNDQLKNPAGIFVDENEDVYIADAGNDRIQLWKKDAEFGITVAGGNGRGNGNNQLTDPKKVFVNTSGDIYIADFCNHRIQIWPKESEYGITIAGKGFDTADSLLLNYPKSFFISDNNDLFITDQHNHRIVHKEYMKDVNLMFEAKSIGQYKARIILKNGIELQTNSISVDSAMLIQKTRELLMAASKKIHPKMVIGDSLSLKNQSISIKWKMKDDLLSVYDNHSLVAKKAGVSSFTLVTENNSGCIFSTSVSITVIPPRPTTRDTSFTYDHWVTEQSILKQIYTITNAEVLLFRDSATTDTIKNFEPFTNQSNRFWVKQSINGQYSEASQLQITFIPKSISLKIPFGKNIAKNTTVATAKIYPNPSPDYFLLNINIPTSEITNITTYTMWGQRIESISANKNVIQFGHNYLPGYYTITITYKAGQQSFIIMKNKK